MTKERIKTGLDDWIQKTQYGFREGKSTAQAIFLARRLIDAKEKNSDPITLILLDWEKAFDKVDQAKLLEALKRLNVPPNIMALITNMYRDPKFKVVVGQSRSNY